ncbi:RDD family protein [Luteimonas soli]|uniref:RDD family protein n=1 Tax=Luteimonas soli TaxID=1648966 RepID=A0ABV7XM13_9GAMM
MTGAGFWRRYAGWSLDAMLLAVPSVLLCWPLARPAAAALASDYPAVLWIAGHGMGQALRDGTPMTALAAQWLADPALRAGTEALAQSLLALLWPPLLVFAVLGAIWHVAFETSARQATPGQRLLGLRVADTAGARIDRGRALLRHAAGALSWLTLNIGHALVLLRPDRRALHDLVAGTVVMQDADPRAKLPPLAQAWLGLQLLALWWAVVVWFGITSDALQRGLDAAFGL